ncbi:major facilitator superfamily domain-containing protein [Aspergillus crustosus]
MLSRRQGRAWYHWFAESDTPEERKLILKLDLLIVPYAFIGFWINYIDSSNINNAWVGELADDLGFHGNELVNFQTIYQVGSVIGIPFAFLLPRFPMNWLVPGMGLFWGVLTLLQYRVQSYSELMAYQVLLGMFESSFFIGVHFVLGSWYRPTWRDIYIGLTLGPLTASLIQSAVSANLEDTAGLAGWRWQFIIVSLMTFVVAIAGFFIWPGTPSIPNKLFLTDAEIHLARKRMADNGTGDTLTTAKHALLPLLRGLGIAYVFFVNFSSDLWLGRLNAIILAHLVNITSMTILVVWTVPESALWFVFNIYYFNIGMSSVLYGWANDILRHDPQQRAIILIVMNTLPTAIRAWIGLLVLRRRRVRALQRGNGIQEASTPVEEVGEVTHIPVKSDGGP